MFIDKSSIFIELSLKLVGTVLKLLVWYNKIFNFFSFFRSTFSSVILFLEISKYSRTSRRSKEFGKDSKVLLHILNLDNFFKFYISSGSSFKRFDKQLISSKFTSFVKTRGKITISFSSNLIFSND
jgi:hypothetical protein